MHPDLKTVIELHHIDLRASELTAQIESLPSQIEVLERGLQEFIRAHEDRKKRLAANQKERRDLEGEIQEVQSRISKHKDQLYEVKTNEQYRAMLKEIEGEQAKIREIEDRVLERMIEAEDLQKKVQEAEAHLESEKARVATEKAKLEAERQKVSEELDLIQARRRELASALDATVVEVYERVRKARRGVALAEVRDGFCAACNVRLRPQIYNEARTNEAILTCENCSRILYYVEPPVTSDDPAKKNDARAAL